MEAATLRSSTALAELLVLSGSLSVCQSTPPGLKTSLTAALKPSSASLVLELDRAILVLKRGLKENWETGDQYLAAFHKTPATDSAGQSVRDAKSYIECEIEARFRSRQIWDEGPPLGVEADRTIIEFTKLRDEAAQAATAKGAGPNLDARCTRIQLPEGTAPAHPDIVVSAGVAAGMLLTKVDPVYPPYDVSGTVVLLAVINTKGRVESLRVISGPALLQQSALEAVRQWKYRPYRLNNRPVEVETTINVVFAR
ncbi:MAG TPA: energy transducer TonB [Terracidiphilus sp.]|jgi:TonB family protein